MITNSQQCNRCGLVACECEKMGEPYDETKEDFISCQELLATRDEQIAELKAENKHLKYLKQGIQYELDNSAFVMLDRPPTKKDYYIAKGIQSQFCSFVVVEDSIIEPGTLVTRRINMKEQFPIRSFITYWSIPEPLIPFVPIGKAP